MPSTPLPEWEKLLASAAHLQKIVPETVLVGGTAAATFAYHGQSARQQLQVQLANPLPYDLDDTDLRQYKNLRQDYQDWVVVAEKCRAIANVLW